MADKKKKMDPEAQRIHKEEQARASRRRNRQLIGLALAILVVVGAVSIVMAGVNRVRDMLDNTDEWGRYQELYEPMVWFDILPFESVTTVDENVIKEICLWGYMSTTPETEITRDDYGQALVPSYQVDQYAVELFGPDFRFSGHDSFVDQEWDLTYMYNPETQVYTMPSTGLEARYYATVVEVENVSWGERRVVIGYVSTRTGDNQVVQQLDYDHPVKYMDYMLRRDGSNYYLYAIRNNTTHTVTGNSTPAQSLPDASTSEVLPENHSPSAPSSSPVAASPDASPDTAGSAGDGAPDADGSGDGSSSDTSEAA